MSAPQSAPLSLPKCALLGLAGALLLWRIVVTNVGEHFVQSEAADAAARALNWDDTNPRALFNQGLAAARTTPADALQLLEAAVRRNPAEGRNYAVIGRVRETAGDLPAAERAMRTAAEMTPRRIDVQQEVAAFWMRRGDVARALAHLDVVLSFGFELRPRVYPELLRLVENPSIRPAFASLLQKQVVWWPEFFGYAAGNATRVDSLRALFEMQSNGPNKATPGALRAYLQRLQSEGFWQESYFVWLNSLRKEQLGNIGNLFNGGFEEPISNLGFDWIAQPVDPVLVDTAASYGATGTRALHVVFRGPRIQYRHLSQHMMLDAGGYTLHGRVRPESFEAARGAQWSISCLGRAEPLAVSERFVGTDQWRHFSVSFEVPASACPVQVIRLELAGRIALDFDAKGALWFDDLAIDRQRID